MKNKLVVVDRDKFKLVVWHLLNENDRTNTEDRFGIWRKEKTYSVAIGATGYATPAGVYYVSNKALNPDWRMPDSDWVAPADRGKLIPGGDPRNPLKGAFISLGGRPIDGIGFHGTAQRDSIGSRASHGCIRMREEDVLNLYDRVEIGTLVFIY